MGRQVRFWMLSEDEEEFLKFSKEQAYLILWGRSPVPEPAIIEGRLPAPDERHELFGHAGQLWIARAADLGDLVWKHAEPCNDWFFDVDNGPVVEFSRSYWRNGELVDGRIWAEMTRLVRGPGDELYVEHKSPEFVALYEALAKWLRRRYKRGPDAGWYVGPAALRWRKEGGTLAFRVP